MLPLPPPAIVISYSDSGVSHHGYIYQASNFIYTGTTGAKKEANTGEGWHWRAAWKKKEGVSYIEGTQTGNEIPVAPVSEGREQDL